MFLIQWILSKQLSNKVRGHAREKQAQSSRARSEIVSRLPVCSKVAIHCKLLCIPVWVYVWLLGTNWRTANQLLLCHNRLLSITLTFKKSHKFSYSVSEWLLRLDAYPSGNNEWTGRTHVCRQICTHFSSSSATVYAKKIICTSFTHHKREMDFPK